jgi:hypothetical protein
MPPVASTVARRFTDDVISAAGFSIASKTLGLFGLSCISLTFGYNIAVPVIEAYAKGEAYGKDDD